MSLLVYNITLWFYQTGIRVASLFHHKAEKWISGRKNVFNELKNSIPPGEKIIWIHCASLGEFEQGRPIIERLRAEGTGHKILLSFFSPSGFEVRKDYSKADWVVYLPLDSQRNAREFLEITKPGLAIFVKYEYWYYYLKELNDREIPVLLVSAIFRKDSPFFKWYGKLQRKMLGFFDHLFVQNEESKNLLAPFDLSGRVTVAGDTRFDRVVEIAGLQKEFPEIARFVDQTTIVAGSTWKEDELLLKDLVEDQPGLKLLIAPHDIHANRLKELRSLFPSSMLYSELTGENPGSMSKSILIIDNIGFLAHIYKYGWLTYVGGGFKKGLHNVLEAAVHNKIVFYGPLYERHQEAVGLMKTGGGIPVKNAEELKSRVSQLLSDPDDHRKRSLAAGEFVRSHTGATKKIMEFIQEKRLLIN